MSKPTKATVTAARADVIEVLGRLRAASRGAEEDWAQLETFCAIAMRVMAKTNLSKLRSETATVELSARLAGRTVFDYD